VNKAILIEKKQKQKDKSQKT
jgi:hypothetical protein